jgi:organic hydroperoxide reductase OsmC/OhrA
VDPYPHRYVAAASGALSGAVSVSSPGLPGLTTAPAPQYGGPGGIWSPETLLTAAIANCYVLTFRAVSAAAMFGWVGLECEVEGVVRKVDRALRFATIAMRATLTIAPGADAAKARRLLRQADRACLIANSLAAECSLEPRVVIAPAGRSPPHGAGAGPGGPSPQAPAATGAGRPEGCPET